MDEFAKHMQQIEDGLKFLQAECHRQDIAGHSYALVVSLDENGFNLLADANEEDGDLFEETGATLVEAAQAVFHAMKQDPPLVDEQDERGEAVFKGTGRPYGWEALTRSPNERAREQARKQEPFSRHSL